MSVDFRSAGHSGDESHHYYRQASAPTASDPLQVGDLWSDTTANLLKRCTSLSPVTFVSVEGGSSAHDLFSATHGDVDELDTPADGQVLKFNSAAGLWRAEDEAGGAPFVDTTAIVKDPVDATKLIRLDAGIISTGTTRVLQMPDSDVQVDDVTSARPPQAHSSSHQNGDTDEISVAGLSGELADPQPPKTHAAAHADGGADELAVQDLASDAATDGQVAKANGAGAVAFEDDDFGINFIIDGGGSAITTGIKGDLELPFAGVIESVRLSADQSGSIVIDIWKDTYANAPPTVADTITASAKPTLSSAQKSEDTTLTGWTTTVTAGDWLRFNVDSITTVTRVTLSIRGRQT